jgi:peptidoglycan/LPS O-acetylase OafA/YrhL
MSKSESRLPLELTAAPVRGNWRRGDTTFMMAAAALLICNSHLEHFYTYSWMAGDGLLGNAMFFFLSGFGLALSANSFRLGFFQWYGRRIKRIYPAAILCTIVFDLIIDQRWRWAGPLDYVQRYVWPTPYDYIKLIMIFYILIYFVLRSRSRVAYAAAFGALTAACLAAAALVIRKMDPHEQLSLGELGWVHRFYFGIIPLLGATLAPITSRPVKTFGRDFAMIAAVFFVYLAAKFEMVHGHGSRYFLVLHVLTIAFCILSLRISASDELQSFFARVKPIGAIVTLLGGLTLELYVVQQGTFAHLETLDWSKKAGFAAFWIITITGAIILHQLVVLVMKPLESKKAAPQPAAIAR